MDYGMPDFIFTNCLDALVNTLQNYKTLKMS